MTPTQRDALEGITKVMVVAGTFLSALAGTYLAVDSVTPQTTERFRAGWLWVPTVFILPVGWIVSACLDPETALNEEYYTIIFVLDILVGLLVFLRFSMFWSESANEGPADVVRARKISWIILVLGFDLLFFGSVVDAFGFFGRH